MAREEDAEREPSKIGEYGKSKREAEEWLKKSGVPFTILRPDCIFGEGRPLPFALFKMVADHRIWLPYGGRAMLRPVYVGDLMKVMEICIERGVRREVYNVGGGLICSVDGFVNMIEEIMYGKRCAERYRLNGKDAEGG